jgi:hypothetical protein
MKYISIALVFIAFFALIGFACYFTSSGLPLWALIFTPQWSSKSDDDE